MDDYRPLEVKVWGEFACFTRPEMKVERVSYPVMTPSAARGVLEAIFWKPQFRWLVREIAVLKPISYFSILRNEVNSRASEAVGRRRVSGGEGYFSEEDRAQRNTLGLRDVAYVVRADVEVRAGIGEDAAKFRDQFRRRVQRGQCFHQPYLGCREFTAYFAPAERDLAPIDRTEDLGRMLFDLDYEPGGDGRGSPCFFNARLDRGVLQVPPSLYATEV
jgi:CRISPR-associated protein Cas5d